MSSTIMLCLITLRDGHSKECRPMVVGKRRFFNFYNCFKSLNVWQPPRDAMRMAVREWIRMSRAERYNYDYYELACSRLVYPCSRIEGDLIFYPIYGTRRGTDYFDDPYHWCDKDDHYPFAFKMHLNVGKRTGQKQVQPQAIQTVALQRQPAPQLESLVDTELECPVALESQEDEAADESVQCAAVTVNADEEADETR